MKLNMFRCAGNLGNRSGAFSKCQDIYGKVSVWGSYLLRGL